jgi:hypothetical protein
VNQQQQGSSILKDYKFINLGDQMLVPQVNNHKLSMGLSFISSFIYFGEEPMEDVSNPTKLYFLLPFLQWLEE